MAAMMEQTDTAACATEVPARAKVVDLPQRPKVELIIQTSNLPATVEALRDLLAKSDRLFDRGVPVRIVHSASSDLPSVIPLTKNNVVTEAHRHCQPMKLDRHGDLVAVTLPDRIANMFLDLFGEWSLRPLSGISTAPLLSDDGSVRSAIGYDPATGLWCWRIPDLSLLSRPTRNDAENALKFLRQVFRTFPFADASRRVDPMLGHEVVDTAIDPAQDESSLLVALMTACCRPSLWLAPAFLVWAPQISGAGNGKGLLIRAINMIAFGIKPRAFTPGHNRDEFEKRLAAEFGQAQPAVFIDNANGVSLRSDTLASVLTERPASVRVLGETRMMQLNSTAFVAVTGNGITLSEDLARRFIVCELDARCEDPEARPFAPGFLDQIEAQRSKLLCAVLTIWRWGRQNASELKSGKSLGSFENWSRWCRDPLIALGCTDPVERTAGLKSRDPRRLRVAEIFAVWWDSHGNSRVKASELSDLVCSIIDPQSHGRQFVESAVSKLVGTHVGGFVLSRQTGPGRWSVATYVLSKSADPEAHRGHRGDGGAVPELVGAPTASVDPMPPMPPMPCASVDGEEAVLPGEEKEL
jgi:hypothetical protein